MDYAGAELEADFHTRWGLDILDFFRGRLPWGKLLRLVERLPTASEYRNLALKDRGLAEMLLAEEAQDPEYHRLDEGELDLPFTDETPTYQQLRNVTDLLRQLIYVTAANAKAQPPEPSPRPETALDKLRHEVAQDTLDDALMQLIGETW